MNDKKPSRRWLCLWWPDKRIALLWPQQEEDYPAAHSMDSQWFAVDADGRVATGDTGEGGCAFGPFEQYQFTSEVEGAFIYELDADYTSYVSPYVLTKSPAQPIHIDQLPPDVRAQFKTVVLERIRFSETRILQLVEHKPCAFYGDPSAYLASDFKTLRPIPGREEEFLQYIEELRRDDPCEVLKNYVPDESIKKGR